MSSSPPPPDLTTLLNTLESTRLTLQRLTESISALPPSSSSPDVTTNTTTNPLGQDDDDTGRSSYPATLELELGHYKELFSQQRFSYLEQVTKEKFLRSITDDHSLDTRIPTPADNERLEAHVRAAKDQLRRVKRDVAEILDEIVALARRLSPAWETLEREAAKARTLPQETVAQQRQIAQEQEAQQARAGGDARPGMHLPLADTRARVDAAASELHLLQTQLRALTDDALPRKRALTARLDRAIAAHERDRDGLERFASEAVRAREGARAAGMDDRENTGQWYKSSHEILTALLD